jgi:hypothetical protein
MWILTKLLSIILLLSVSFSTPAWAGLQDDHYDGNIFALYGSNGGMIPPRVTVSDSLNRHIPVLLVYYIDDSRDCKTYAAVIANLQVRYGSAVNFIAYALDALDLQDPTGPAQYLHQQSPFQISVPQTVLLNQAGEIVYERMGAQPIREVENQIRFLFNLEPVTTSSEAHNFNEVQTGFGS